MQAKPQEQKVCKSIPKPRWPVIEQAILALWRMEPAYFEKSYENIAERLNQEYHWALEARDIFYALEPSIEIMEADLRQQFKIRYGYDADQ